MLTYSSKTREIPASTEKPWLLWLLSFIWLWPGILGHDPWRPSEPQTLAIIQEMMTTGQWMTPKLLGVADFSILPLYYWVASVFVKVFSPWLLSVADAARVTTTFFMTIAFILAGMSAHSLLGRRYGRTMVMMLIACFGLVMTGHQLNPMAATYAGFSGVFFALCLSLRSFVRAAMVFALSWSMIFWSSSLLASFIVVGILLALPLCKAWRTRRYLWMVLLIFLLAIPVLMIWPITLWNQGSTLFYLWWDDQLLATFDQFSFVHVLPNIAYYLRNLAWYAFPAWPLALWTLYRHRQNLVQVKLQLPLIFFGVSFLVLVLASELSNEWIMAMLLPIALIAIKELDHLRRGPSAFLNWFGAMTFGAFAAFIWLGWFAMNFSWPERLYLRSRYFSPYYEAEVSWLAALFAFVAMIIWLAALSRKHLRGTQSITNWAAGITLVWGMLLSLWLPWFDQAKSYRPVVESMVQKLPDNFDCVATSERNKLARISWPYFENINLIPLDEGQVVPCDYQLVMTQQDLEVKLEGWQKIWQGSRPRDKYEQYILIQRIRP